MGGYGSGRDGWRITVESCLAINMYYMQRKGLLNGMGGNLRWSQQGEEMGSVNYSVNHNDKRLLLSYRAEGQFVELRLTLATTKTNFGGFRYWVLCPRCGRRSAKLYLPSGGLHFRCRRCYNLTYQSCNESRKFDSVFRSLAVETGMPFNVVKDMMKKGAWQ